VSVDRPAFSQFIVRKRVSLSALSHVEWKERMPRTGRLVVIVNSTRAQARYCSSLLYVGYCILATVATAQRTCLALA